MHLPEVRELTVLTIASEERAYSTNARIAQHGQKLRGALPTPVEQGKFFQSRRCLQRCEVLKPLEVLDDYPTQGRCV